MSTHFRKFLRTAPVDSLQAYLVRAAPTGFGDVDWRAARSTLVESLTGKIHALEDSARNGIYGDVDRIGQFPSDHGRRVLRGVLGSDDQELLGAFDAMEDVTGCALLVMMRSAAAFEKALSALYAQRLMNGRDWTGLDFEPGTELKVRPGAALSGFEQRVRTIFAADGPPPRLSVERFSRHEPDPAGAGTLAREQFTIFVEAPPETALAFAEGSTVEPRTVRPVREAAVIFDETERTLDVVARGGGKTRRREIAEAFAETMLVPGAAFLNRARRALALDRLKVRPMFDVRPEDGVRSVEVTKLALGRRHCELRSSGTWRATASVGDVRTGFGGVRAPEPARLAGFVGEIADHVRAREAKRTT